MIAKLAQAQPKTSIGSAIAIVVMMAVVLILITPDPTDDVDGILQLDKRVLVPTSVVDSALSVPLSIHSSRHAHTHLASKIVPNLLELLCASRC
jgi:hypothetical protein